MMRGILQEFTNHGVTTKYHSEMVMLTQKDGSGRYPKTILRGVNGHFPSVSEEAFLPAPRTSFSLKWLFQSEGPSLLKLKQITDYLYCATRVTATSIMPRTVVM